MEKLLKDNNTMVLGSAVAAFTEVCARMCQVGGDTCADVLYPDACLQHTLSCRGPGFVSNLFVPCRV